MDFPATVALKTLFIVSFVPLKLKTPLSIVVLICRGFPRLKMFDDWKGTKNVTCRKIPSGKRLHSELENHHVQ
jgi:hypothetical protein